MSGGMTHFLVRLMVAGLSFSASPSRQRLSSAAPSILTGFDNSAAVRCSRARLAL